MLKFTDMIDFTQKIDGESTPRVHAYLRFEGNDLQIEQNYGKTMKGDYKCAVKTFQSGRITILEPEIIEFKLRTGMHRYLEPGRFYCVDEDNTLRDLLDYYDEETRHVRLPHVNQEKIKTSLEAHLIQIEARTKDLVRERTLPRQLSVIEQPYAQSTVQRLTKINTPLPQRPINVHYGAYYTIHSPNINPETLQLQNIFSNAVFDAAFIS